MINPTLKNQIQELFEGQEVLQWNDSNQYYVEVKEIDHFQFLMIAMKLPHMKNCKVLIRGNDDATVYIIFTENK